MPSGRPGGLLHEQLTFSIIGAFYEVHRRLGCGFREYIYALALEQELRSRGHHVEREVAVMVYYRGKPLARQVMDMVVDHRVIIDNKVTDRLREADSLPLFGYLCATDIEVGLVLYFTRVPRFHRVLCENHLKHRT